MTPRFLRDTAILIVLGVVAAAAFAIDGASTTGGLTATAAIVAAIGLMALTGWPGARRSQVLLTSRVRTGTLQKDRPVRLVPPTEGDREEERRAA